MGGRYAENPSYVLYERLLVELHSLIAAGKGDAPEADALRDAMEEPTRHLTRAEIIRLNGLSADLYMLHGEEVLQPPNGRPLDLRELHDRILEAQQWNDWESVLGLLRQRDASVPHEPVALSRAKAYDALGHSDTAILFLDYAATFAPNDPGYAPLRMMLMTSTSRIFEAARDARHVLTTPDASPLLRIVAIDALFNAERMRDEHFPREYEAGPLLDALDSALRSAETSPNIPVDVLVLAHLLRVSCLDALGRVEEAARACDEALRHDPDDKRLQELRSHFSVHPHPVPSNGALRILLDHVRVAVQHDLWPRAAA